MKFLLQTFLIAFFTSVGCVWADALPESEITSETTSAPKAMDEVVPQEGKGGKQEYLPLSKIYYRAFTEVYGKKFAQAARSLELLKKAAQAQGYENLPDYSFELLSLADQALGREEREEARFIIKHAADLSPGDAGVSFVVSSFVDVLGYSQALVYLMRFFRSVWFTPVFGSAIAINSLLLGLVALTISFFIVCVVQILKGGEIIYEVVLKNLPRSVGGILCPLVVYVLLAAPLFGGILLAVCCWSLILAYLKRGCSWLGFLAGALTVSWALSLPILSTVSFNAALGINRVIEIINNYSFTPKGEKLVLAHLKRESNEPLLYSTMGQSTTGHFTLGQLRVQQGRLEEALSSFQQVVADSGASDKLREAAELNIAGIMLRQDKPEKAQELMARIEAGGNSSFELLYNSALTYLALLDTTKHSFYYARARDKDVNRLKVVEARGNAHQEPLLVVLPRSEYGPLLFRSIGELDLAALDRSLKLQQRIVRELLVFADTGSLNMFGIVVLVLGLGALVGRGEKRKSYRLYREMSLDSAVSSIWKIIPGGAFFAGEKPVLGLVLLGVFMALIVSAVGGPLPFYGLPSFEVAFREYFLILAIFFFTLCAALSFMPRFWSLPNRGED